MDIPNQDSSYKNVPYRDLVKGVLLLILLTLFFSFLTGNLLSNSVKFDLELAVEDYISLLTHLGILALITERFVEIFTGVMRKPGRVELTCKIKATTGEEQIKAKKALNNYRAQTGIVAITISFVTGLILASAGIHVLEPLFDTNELSATQLNYFDAIDIIITAGLIAGGSKGINALTSSIGAVLSSLKKQSRADTKT